MTLRRNVSQDRRSYSRQDVFLESELIYNSQSYPARLVDLSLGGARIASSILPPVGTHLQINFTTNNGKRPISLTGTVVRRIRYAHRSEQFSTFGIKFPGISADLLMLMKEMLAVTEESRRNKQASHSFHLK